MKKVLAFDMGATSIRGIVGFLENGQFCTQEVMRMNHKIQGKNGRLVWDWDGIIGKIEETILENADVSAIGIDSWGVDFGLIDQEGNLLQAPFSYRDEKFIIGRKEADSRIEEATLFQNSGNQIMTINTVYQLLALKTRQPDVYEKADKLLMIPDLIYYFLTGEKIGEESIWSTTGLYDLTKKEVSATLFQILGLKKELVPKIVKAGEWRASTKNAKCERLRKLDIDVIPVCGHDTASALLMTEVARDRDALFLSCGTWSLIGTAVDRACTEREAYESNLTNELGYGSETYFFKNITGLYLFEKYKTQLEEKLGRKISFEEISSYVGQDFARKDKENGASGAENAGQENKEALIDMDAEVFSREDVQVKKEIDAFLKEKGVETPGDDFSYFTLIYDSMVEKYKEVKEDIERILGRQFTKLQMIGGGAKSEVLAARIAQKLQLNVKAGPYESSALGNILLTLLYEKEVASVNEGREKICEASEVKYYQGYRN